MKYKSLLLSILTIMSMSTRAQTPVQPMPSIATNTIFNLPPFERAVCCIKYYEGMHRKKDYPYVGYGHQIKSGEKYSSDMSLSEADALLRKDLKELCTLFRKYGKDSLLLATLAYNVGPYHILGCKGKHPRPKSNLLKEIESGIRDFQEEYVQFCHWRGKKIPSIERRRYLELILLYER